MTRLRDVAKSVALTACVVTTAYFCLATDCAHVTASESATVAVPFEAGQRSAILRLTAEGGDVSLRMDRQVAVTLNGQAIGPEPDAGVLADSVTSVPYCGAPSTDPSTADAADVVICENLEALAQPVDYELVRENAERADTVTVTGTVSVHTCDRLDGPLGIRLEATEPP